MLHYDIILSMCIAFVIGLVFGYIVSCNHYMHTINRLHKSNVDLRKFKINKIKQEESTIREYNVKIVVKGDKVDSCIANAYDSDDEVSIEMTKNMEETFLRALTNIKMKENEDGSL